ncbi:MAG: hypothetical protein K5672_04170 [Bacteroidaceae bacterium]|nr:hypothetical protein [Bacteroidaceae bacterium]
MKKLFFVVMAFAAISFASCCNKCEKNEGCTCDTCKCEPCECGQKDTCATEACEKEC